MEMAPRDLTLPEIYLNAKVLQPFCIRVFFSMVMINRKSFFYHALHCDVIMTLEYSNNLHITYECLSRFENT